MRVAVVRHGGFAGPIQLQVAGLPEGVTLARPALVAPGQNSVDIALTATKEANIGSTILSIQGTGYISLFPFSSLLFPMVKPAICRGPGDEPVPIRLAVALPSPFKIVGEYQSNLIPRGTTYARKYRIERNGFTGPIEIELADRQARHLQGLHAAPLLVPGDQSEFEYSIMLPPWMETGRTARACIMGTAILAEKGKHYTVTYSSREQNEQLIAVVEPERLSLNLDRSSLRIADRASCRELKVTLIRGEGLTGNVRVEGIVPAHMHGVTIPPIEIAAHQNEGTLKFLLPEKKIGPWNAPMTIRATLMHKGRPVIAENKLELIP